MSAVGQAPAYRDRVSSWFAVRWSHDSPDDPVRIFEELDDDRFELRVVEEFGDGRLIRSDRISPTSITSRSWVEVPSEAEIDAQDEFAVEPLTTEEFESIWQRAVDAQ